MTHKLHPHPPSRVKSTILLLFLTNCAFLPHKMEKKNDNHTIFSHSDTKAWRYGIKVGGRGSLGGRGVALGKGRNTREGHREWRGGTGRRQGISGASVCCWTHFSLTPASQSRWPDPGPGPPQASARSSVFSSLWGRKRSLITIISYTISTWSATRGIQFCNTVWSRIFTQWKLQVYVFCISIQSSQWHTFLALEIIQIIRITQTLPLTRPHTTNLNLTQKPPPNILHSNCTNYIVYQCVVAQQLQSNYCSVIT